MIAGHFSRVQIPIMNAFTRKRIHEAARISDGAGYKQQRLRTITPALRGHLSPIKEEASENQKSI